ncbi:MAG: hypothetical protein OXE78_04975, partial [Gammaproteobacteria bacterium]|nr:hypothetical protein [Gammaproteobacteria bacterium]
LALAVKARGGVLSWDDIYDLTENIRNKKSLSMDNFLTNALHAGVLMEIRNRPKDYMIPIPSFEDYLRKLPIEPPLNMSSS